MFELILDPEQSQMVAAGRPVVVRDASGRELGVFTSTVRSDDTPLSITPEEVGELARRMAKVEGDWPTTSEVLARLRSRVAS